MDSKVTEVASEIRRLSECRKLDWDKSQNIDPDEDFYEFLTRIKAVEDVTIVRALLRTFDDSFDDGGTQEIVCNLLNSVSNKTFNEALMAEKNYLYLHAPEWFEVIVDDRQGLQSTENSG